MPGFLKVTAQLSTTDLAALDKDSQGGSKDTIKIGVVTNHTSLLHINSPLPAGSISAAHAVVGPQKAQTEGPQALERSNITQSSPETRICCSLGQTEQLSNLLHPLLPGSLAVGKLLSSPSRPMVPRSEGFQHKSASPAPSTGPP